MCEKKIVLDTNILISALGWRGKPNEIFRKVINGELELIISKKQIEELQLTLEYPKFSFTESQKSRFLEILLAVARIVENHGKFDLIKDDPDDNVILGSAIENNADFIISGDMHLLRLRKYNNIKIVTAAEFLDIIKY